MTDEEVNKVIAEYMFGKHYSKGCPNNHFIESLDALVPVWEKLKECSYPKFHKNEKGFSVSMSVEYFKGYNRVEFVEVYEMKSIQQAAAHATAKAIKELGNQT